MPGAPRQPESKLAFWIHQAVEYLVGFLVLSQALQAADPVVPVVAAGVVLALAATADGPLAAFRLVPRGLHRVLDVVAAVALAAVGIVFRDDLGGLGVVVLAGVGVVLAALVYRTDYRGRAQRAARPAATTPRRVGSADPSATTSSGASADARTRAPTSASTGEEVGRRAGRLVAQGVRAYRRRAKS